MTVSDNVQNLKGIIDLFIKQTPTIEEVKDLQQQVLDSYNLIMSVVKNHFDLLPTEKNPSLKDLAKRINQTTGNEKSILQSNLRDLQALANLYQNLKKWENVAAINKQAQELNKKNSSTNNKKISKENVDSKLNVEKPSSDKRDIKKIIERLNKERVAVENDYKNIMIEASELNKTSRKALNDINFEYAKRKNNIQRAQQDKSFDPQLQEDFYNNQYKKLEKLLKSLKTKIEKLDNISTDLKDLKFSFENLSEGILNSIIRDFNEDLKNNKSKFTVIYEGVKSYFSNRPDYANFQPSRHKTVLDIKEIVNDLGKKIKDKDLLETELEKRINEAESIQQMGMANQYDELPKEDISNPISEALNMLYNYIPEMPYNILGDYGPNAGSIPILPDEEVGLPMLTTDEMNKIKEGLLL